ncbi:MAG TPA: DUF5131 family protein [Gammaproteobacteria bacterium]|nr:DUF5131 family protein [Gammaproteobacteria bacterium]
MSEHTEIAWCDATFNPWWGCRKVSPACDFCYAEKFAAWIAPGLWDTAKRRTFGDKHWSEPLRWARKLPAKLGRRPRVFCASMADVFDKEAPPGARERLWDLIRATPELDWLLLTKRIGNVRRMLPDAWRTRGMPDNVWLGITVVNQDEADRDIPKLLAIRARVRFLSIEPMLGPIDLAGKFQHCPVHDFDGGFCVQDCGNWQWIGWTIVGGESGARARPMAADWCWSLLEQCTAAEVPYFFKQGSAANWPSFKDFASFPEGLRVREFPA